MSSFVLFKKQERIPSYENPTPQWDQELSLSVLVVQMFFVVFYERPEKKHKQNKLKGS